MRTLDDIEQSIKLMGHSQQRQDLERLLSECRLLRAHILNIDAHAVPYGEDDDGFITRYLLSTGPLHQALGVIGHSAPKCAACRPTCPSEATVSQETSS